MTLGKKRIKLKRIKSVQCKEIYRMKRLEIFKRNETIEIIEKKVGKL